MWRWLLYPGSGFADQVLRSGRNWVYDVGAAHRVIITIVGIAGTGGTVDDNGCPLVTAEPRGAGRLSSEIRDDDPVVSWVQQILSSG